MSMTIPPAATALRRYLAHHRIPQAKFAMFELNVSETCLQNWLAGRGRPSLQNALRVEELTGIDASGWFTSPGNGEAHRG